MTSWFPFDHDAYQARALRILQEGGSIKPLPVPIRALAPDRHEDAMSKREQQRSALDELVERGLARRSKTGRYWGVPQGGETRT
jgi:hypothetical protein